MYPGKFEIFLRFANFLRSKSGVVWQLVRKLLDCGK